MTERPVYPIFQQEYQQLRVGGLIRVEALAIDDKLDFDGDITELSDALIQHIRKHLEGTEVQFTYDGLTVARGKFHDMSADQEFNPQSKRIPPFALYEVTLCSVDKNLR